MAVSSSINHNSDEPTTAEKIRLLPYSVASNAANTVFVQFTFFGSVFVLFLDQLGVNTTQIGLLLSLFPFFGLVALFIAPAVGRYGYKKTFLLFYGIRKVVAIFLLFVPFVLARFGSTATLVYIASIVLVFALCRAVSETALYPWAQEYIPNSVRGKYAATSNIYSRLTGVVAAAVGGYILSRSAGLDRFITLIAIGVVFGFVSVWAASKRPGGASTLGTAAGQTSIKSLLPVMQDKNLWRFLLGFGLIALVTTPLESFLPLFMQNEVGLTTGVVVWLQTGTLVGGLLTTYLWGWAADRYGSKPVMLSGVYLKLLLPIGWMFIPQNNAFSLPAALTIALIQGMAEVGWIIGSGRLLYVAVVPAEKKNEYMAFYYAAIGIFGGISQLLGGIILDYTAGLDGRLGILDINPFTPLFVAGLVLPGLSLLIFQRVRADNRFSVGEFAVLFLRGHPFAALSNLPRYYLAKDEKAVVAVTEKLGQTKSPLTVEELLDALNDPRFNVRFEAVISIGRMPADPRLVQALRGILTGTELSLTGVAAWALGRMGDARALKPLRDGLNSEYRSIRAHCARALGALGDKQVIPLLIDRLEVETDIGLKMAYGYALGNLQARRAVEPLLALLEEVENRGARREVALSLARIMGQEPLFINLIRHGKEDAGTALSQAITTLARQLGKNRPASDLLVTGLAAAADAFARQQMNTGRDILRQVVEEVLNYDQAEEINYSQLLTHAADHLHRSDDRATLYSLLTVIALTEQVP